jgi:hypothetical protein
MSGTYEDCSFLIPEPSAREVFDNTDWFPVEATETLLEEQQRNNPSNAGVTEAVRLMLSESAVAIQFVDISAPADWVPHENPPSFKRSTQLGFNDHGGGSESAHRILINRYVEGQEPEQYVLFSPPEETGEPSNLVFHNSDFTFLTLASNGCYPYDIHLPNPLKTGGQAGQTYGRNHYNFFLFGGSEVPYEFAQTFVNAGFSFNGEPYDMEKYDKLKLGRPKMRYLWPDGQFAEQIANL